MEWNNYIGGMESLAKTAYFARIIIFVFRVIFENKNPTPLKK
jgi:hypothetical protein